MILRPVSPASPCGPPTTKRPVGLMRTSASATSKPASPSTGRTTSAITPSRSSTLSILSECWVDTTTLLIPTGRIPSYTTLTWLALARRAGDLSWLRPDGRTQVSVVYEGMRPVGISKVVVSTQHSDKIDNVELREGVIALVVRPVLGDAGFEVADADVLINPTGRFVVGGPQGDAGLTGRKIIVDTYGGMARHGGGAF